MSKETEKQLAKSVSAWVNRVVDDMPSGEEMCEARVCGYIEIAERAAWNASLVSLREIGSHIARRKCEDRGYGVGDAARDIAAATKHIENIISILGKLQK